MMTSFGNTDFVYAIAIGLVTGVWAVAGTRSQKSILVGLQALEQRMGRLFPIALFSSAALPTAAMWLVGALRGGPTAFDAIVIVVLIGLGMIASFTLLGNALKQLADRGRL
jgi:type IV secretory pathway VirB2 component (pilin)